jgi:hypothetical protein
MFNFDRLRKTIVKEIKRYNSLHNQPFEAMSNSSKTRILYSGQTGQKGQKLNKISVKKIRTIGPPRCVWPSVLFGGLSHRPIGRVPRTYG